MDPQNADGHGCRALVVAYCFPPNAAIGTHRTLRLVTHLASVGWTVDVLTVHPRGYLPGTATDEQLLDRVPISVRVIRTGALRGFTRLGRVIEPLKSWISSRRSTAVPASNAQSGQQSVPPTGLKTLVEELFAMPDKDVGWLLPALARALPSFAFARPDVVFSSAPPWTTHVVAGVLASAFRCRWVADFRDPWVRSPWVRYRTPTARAIARRMESLVVRHADAVVFTTEAARHEFAAHYGPELARRFNVVFNGCDPAEVPRSEILPDGDRFVLLHAGNLYAGRSPMPLIQAVARVRKAHPQAERLCLRFLGTTSFPGVDLQGHCKRLGLEGIVEFLPRVSREESLTEMKRALALVILQGGTTMAIPGKLYEYLAVGRPVLALSEPGEMTRLIRSNRLGVTALPDSGPDIERALLALLAKRPGSWTAATPDLFDGRLRAAEMGAIIRGVVQPNTRSVLAVQADTGGRRA